MPNVPLPPPYRVVFIYFFFSVFSQTLSRATLTRPARFHEHLELSFALEKTFHRRAQRPFFVPADLRLPRRVPHFVDLKHHADQTIWQQEIQIYFFNQYKYKIVFEVTFK